MKLTVIGPGFTVNINYSPILPSHIDPDVMASDEKILAHATEHYLELIKKGEPFTIVAAENEAFTIYYPRPGDHFVIMSEKLFRNIQREQMFAMQQGRNRRG